MNTIKEEITMIQEINDMALENVTGGTGSSREGKLYTFYPAGMYQCIEPDRSGSRLQLQIVKGAKDVPYDYPITVHLFGRPGTDETKELHACVIDESFECIFIGIPSKLD